MALPLLYNFKFTHNFLAINSKINCLMQKIVISDTKPDIIFKVIRLACQKLHFLINTLILFLKKTH